MSSNKTLFGFHAVSVRLKTHPESVIEIHVDATRRDQRMRQFIARSKDAGDPKGVAGSLQGTWAHSSADRATAF